MESREKEEEKSHNNNTNTERSKTIVLDLDNTLINTTFSSPPPHYDFTILIHQQQEHPTLCYVQKRPAVDDLFLHLSKNKYEIIVFTAAYKAYADQILDKLDSNKSIKHRLYRDSCSRSNGLVFKDLAKLGRDLKNVMIVDDIPRNYKMQPQNGFPINPFHGDLSDRELWRLIDFCNIAEKCEDLRDAIAIHNALNKSVTAEIQRLREREREREREMPSFLGFNLNYFRSRCKTRRNKKTIVLGLFDVLIKASFVPLTQIDFIISVAGNENNCSSSIVPYYVMKRPGVDKLLSELGKVYEIVVFAEAPKKDADLFLDKLDVNMSIKRRLYRGSSWNGRDHVKNLDKRTVESVLDVDLKDVLIVDHDKVSYKFERENWVMVKKFRGDAMDGELYEVKEFCKAAAMYEDVREFKKEVPYRFRNENKIQIKSPGCTIQ